MKKFIIELLLQYGILGTNFKQPITFKSGIRSPIYFNFRRCSVSPNLRELIAEGLREILSGKNVNCIFGVPLGAIPHAERTADKMVLPSGYVRPDAKVKDHGLKKLIEGYDDISGKTVGLIEDLVSTGGSIIGNAEILLKHGVKKVELVSIFSYEMEIAKKEFAEAGFELNSLITIYDVLPFLKETLPESDYASLEDWVCDPEGWFDRHKTEFEFGFLTDLRKSAENANSIICFGLDPVIESLPKEHISFGIDGFVSLMRDVFSELSNKCISPGMFKPNLAWWKDYDFPFIGGDYSGSNALVDIIRSAKNFFPSVPYTLDTKVGDIGTSSTKWASYGYTKWLANAITVHTYMGSDSIGPFTEYCNKEKKKGAYLLVKTTNKGASDLELKKMADGRFVYEQVADNVIGWAKDKPGVCAVTAGNSPEELSVLSKKFAGKDIGLLIPGVGKSQGGDAGEVAQILRESNFELPLARINLSSGLTHPWYEKGKANPPKNECVDIIVETLRSLNEKVGYVG